ncbi:hypothetical protein AB0383_13720 [Amycolatopsis sp. NPDC051373]
MSSRLADGSAGDADYGEIGKVYTGFRNPDPASPPRSWRRSGPRRPC